MNRRGTSLMEVLIAIFVLALGLVSLLTLFPIGLVQMAKSVQDERAAELAGNAASYMRMMWKSMCEEASTLGGNNDPLFVMEQPPNIAVPTPTSPQPIHAELGLWFPYALDDPNAGIIDNSRTKVLPNAPAAALANVPTLRFNGFLMAKRDQPSYPVFVDPVGWRTGSGQNAVAGLWVAGSNANLTSPGNPLAQATTASPTSSAIPRRGLCADGWKFSHTVATLAPGGGSTKYRAWRSMNTSQLLRTCFLSDDADFSPDGLMFVSIRVPQYSCAWLLRRDRNSSRKDVNVTVVVYHRRSIESASDESTYWASPSLTRLPDQSVNYGSSLKLHYLATEPRPAIRRGGWILDATITPSFTQGYYYRVTDVGEPQASATVAGEMELDVQLESPMRPGLETPEAAASFTKSRKIIIQDRLLEVFDKGPLDMNSGCRLN